MPPNSLPLPPLSSALLHCSEERSPLAVKGQTNVWFPSLPSAPPLFPLSCPPPSGIGKSVPHLSLLSSGTSPLQLLRWSPSGVQRLKERGGREGEKAQMAALQRVVDEVRLLEGEREGG